MSSWLRELRHGRRLASMLATQLRVPLLRTGIHLGLLEALRSPLRPEELAGRLGLAPDLVAAWLRAAAANDLVSEQGGRYQAGRFARWLLDSPEAAALHAMVDQAELTYAPRLSGLPELMKGRERPVFGAPEEALRVAAASRLGERRALEALARVPGVRGSRRVLDVGCGQGTYLAGLLTRYRDAQGVGVELDAAVANEARRVLREAEVSRRGEVRVGDFLTHDLPEGSFDLVLLNNNLHYFSPAQREILFRRILGRLRPRGTLAIQTPVASRGRLARALGSGALVATFDLFLRLHRNLHGLPDPDALAERLRAVGFPEVGRTPITPDGTACYVWARSDPQDA